MRFIFAVSNCTLCGCVDLQGANFELNLLIHLKAITTIFVPLRHDIEMRRMMCCIMILCLHQAQSVEQSTTLAHVSAQL